jgi:hypothetical protein
MKNTEMYLMFKWFNEKGFSADMGEQSLIFLLVPGCPMTDAFIEET